MPDKYYDDSPFYGQEYADDDEEEDDEEDK